MLPRPPSAAFGLPFVVCLLAAACGGGGGSPTAPSSGQPPGPSQGGGAPPATTTITITSAGVSPQVLTVPVGSRVTFANTDARPHDFAGGPDPARPECPQIDEAGFVQAGQSRQTGVFTAAMTCQYHDHAYLGVPAFTGRIVVQ
jgi:plastocyanin